ncbi:hypothetical protein LXL04_031521 [Taraxacum kok-saghyz]
MSSIHGRYGGQRTSIQIPYVVGNLPTDMYVTEGGRFTSGKSQSCFAVLEFRFVVLPVIFTLSVILFDEFVSPVVYLYEAVCLLKSVIKDQAYFLIVERVDIATAVNANGVVVSDQGTQSWIQNQIQYFFLWLEKNCRFGDLLAWSLFENDIVQFELA